MSEAAVRPDGDSAATRERHGGELAVAMIRRHGIDTMFTLSGGHVFPLYDAAVKADPPMHLLDVRHEQSAVFAAEATAKLTRRPGLAVLTAGPGVTNGVSAITTAHFNGSPLLVLGGRAPAARWGTGSLQELDHPPILRPVTKYAATIPEVGAIPSQVEHGLRLAATPRRGPVFLDIAMDQLFSRATVAAPDPVSRPVISPDPDALARVARLLGAARHPGQRVGVGRDHRPRDRVGRGNGRPAEQLVHRNVEEYRSAPRRRRQPEPVLHLTGDGADLGNRGSVLGHRPQDRWVVELLEAASPPASGR